VTYNSRTEQKEMKLIFESDEGILLRRKRKRGNSKTYIIRYLFRVRWKREDGGRVGVGDLQNVICGGGAHNNSLILSVQYPAGQSAPPEIIRLDARVEDPANRANRDFSLLCLLSVTKGPMPFTSYHCLSLTDQHVTLRLVSNGKSSRPLRFRTFHTLNIIQVTPLFNSTHIGATFQYQSSQITKYILDPAEWTHQSPIRPSKAGNNKSAQHQTHLFKFSQK